MITQPAIAVKADPAAPKAWCVDLHDVTKVYRRKTRALDSMNLQIAPGEVFGLLGPNGAGKSTLVKIMMTVIRATHATGTILGNPVGHKPTLARIGYLPEHHRFPAYLTGRQIMGFYGALAGVSADDRRKRTNVLLERVGMSNWADTKISEYSKGMMQRVGLAQALVNDPDLIVLDEPTDGVDPVGRRDIRDLLIELKREGKTIFLNSHLLSETELVCTRVAILVTGRVAMQGTIAELTAESRRFEIEYTGAPIADDHLPEDAHCDAIPDSDRRVITLIGTDPMPAQPLVDHLRKSGCMIHRMTPRVESLEDLFMRAVEQPHPPTTRYESKGGERA